MFGIAELTLFRFNADRNGVMTAVIATFHFDNLAAARHRARETQRMHGDLGTAVAEANHFHRKAFADQYQPAPIPCRAAFRRAFQLSSVLDCPHHRWMTMACKQRTVAEIVVNIFVAVDIVDPASFTVTIRTTGTAGNNGNYFRLRLERGLQRVDARRERRVCAARKSLALFGVLRTSE